MFIKNDGAIIMDSRIRIADKLAILYHTGIKFLRGSACRIFLKETHGMLLVGKNVKITHGKHIRCGKMLSLKISLRFMGCALMA